MADISRDDAAGLLADQNINEILQDAAQSSASLATFRTIRMGTQITKMPILTALPTASWVDGDDGQKSTDDQIWAKKTLTAEELAVIVPIPENVFDDTEFGVWEEVRPRIAEAIGKALDSAVFFGNGAPASLDPSLYEGALTSGQVYGVGDSTVDLAEDINQTWGLVEAVGFDVNTQYASRRIRMSLRGLRDDNNQPIYLESLRSDGVDRSIGGVDLTFVQNGAWDDDVTLIAGDATKAILGIRQDVTYKILTEATLTDGSGNVTVSLAEQDMIALRAKFRVGFVVANTVSSETGSQEYPFAVLSVTGS